MVHAFVPVVLSVFHNVKDGFGKIQGIGWRTCLVEHNFKLRFYRGKTEHRLDEVFAVFTVKPSRAYDDGFAARLLNLSLALEFGDSVHSCRRCSEIFFAWGVVGASPEHIVSGHVHQQSAIITCRLSEILYSCGIDERGLLRLVFGLVDISVCRTVDYDVDIVFLYSFPHSLGIRDIQMHDIVSGHIGKYVFVIGVSGHYAYFIAKLAICSGYKYVHY